MEALVDGDGGDDALAALGAHPVVDPADDLADVDEEQAFLARPGVVRDVRGQELDRPVSEESAAETGGDPASS
ncbi:hypothetical protein ACF05T_26215 [Streptomyces lateritius]|uniref:Uncharacterized protein n=1 Tax=Streptomyces lateritius TaxID=67313 RepID=A0ABW6YI93_9ACTN